MAKYAVNKAAVRGCRELIDAWQYVLISDWGEVAERGRPERVPRNHSWEEYAAWHSA